MANPSTSACLSVSVLIVDDCAETREMYEYALLYSGFGVLHADNGADGLSRAAEAVPDVIVTDLSIPRIDGFELLARIQMNPRTERIPVIVLSGWAEASQRAIAAGAAAFLLKPCMPESLIDEVRRALSLSRA
jgi:CheY-like chemotaxis protein